MKNITYTLIIGILFFFGLKDLNAQTSISPVVGFNLVNIKYQDVKNSNNNIFLPYKNYSYSFGLNVNVPILKKDKSYLVSTGFYYTSYRVNYALNANIDGFNPLVSNIKWTNGYSQVNIPLSFYKSFYFNKSKTGSLSLFAGLSIGFSKQDIAKFSASVAPSKMDEVIAANTFSDLNKKVVIIPCFNGGIDIAPFQGLKNLKFGFLTIINLNKSSSFENGGIFENLTQNTFEAGSISANPVFYSFIFNIKYDFLIKPKALGNSKIKKFDDKSINY